MHILCRLLITALNSLYKLVSDEGSLFEFKKRKTEGNKRTAKDDDGQQAAQGILTDTHSQAGYEVLQLE